MDELWQRYRTFWTPVLIGLGVFLVGVIVVHMLSEDPDQAKKGLTTAERRLERMEMPDPSKSRTLRERAEILLNDNRAWSERINQTGAERTDIVGAGAEQALRAAILRGHPADPKPGEAPLSARFDGDEVAAAKANRRFRELVERHREQLRTGDPNVAFSSLLSDVWRELRVRANRSDVELAAEMLGFSSISSVSRATLPGRVLNLALVARVTDVAIRHGMRAVVDVQVPMQIDPGSPEDFLVLWPVDIVMLGDMPAVRPVLELLTDPEHPVPLETSRLAQPKRGTTFGEGVLELAVRASSAIVRPDVDLKLDVEEEK